MVRGIRGYYGGKLYCRAKPKPAKPKPVKPIKRWCIADRRGRLLTTRFGDLLNWTHVDYARLALRREGERVVRIEMGEAK